jgi:hypothetical protein
MQLNTQYYEPDVYEDHFDDCNIENGNWYECKDCNTKFRDYNHGLKIRSKKPSNYCEDCNTSFHTAIDGNDCTCDILKENHYF